MFQYAVLGSGAHAGAGVIPGYCFRTGGGRPAFCFAPAVPGCFVPLFSSFSGLSGF